MKQHTAARILFLALLLTPAAPLNAMCWAFLMDTWSVCAQGTYGGETCTTYYEWRIVCEGTPGGGGGDPGGGGGEPGGGTTPPPVPPTGCPEVIITNLETIQGSTLSGFARLVGSVSVYPANAQIELSAQGPGISGVGYGSGPFDFQGSLEDLGLGDNTYTVTASGPPACGGYSNSASGIISRQRFRAIASTGAAPYSISFWDPDRNRDRTLYMNGSINGYEIFDHFASSPTGNGNDIPYTRTTSSTAVAKLSTIGDITLFGATVSHEYTGYAYYADAMQPDYGGLVDGLPFSAQAVHWFGLQPAEGISTLENMLVEFMGSTVFSTPAPAGQGFPARAVADFTAATPF